MNRWRNFLTSTLHRVQGSTVQLNREAPLGLSSKAKFVISDDLARRQCLARETLKANGVEIKSLRRQLEDAVAKGDTENAKRLTAETFKAMGVQ